MNLTWPLDVPVTDRLLPDEPGQFGTIRKHDVHTGVDLYCDLGTSIIAMESGTVISMEAFTGTKAQSPWWNDTDIVFVQGHESGIVFGYGEIQPLVSVGDEVIAGQKIGTVSVPVLKTFKGRPTVMLHLEAYLPSTPVPIAVWWQRDEARPPHLLDPTPYIYPLASGRFDLTTYDQKRFRL